VVDRKDKEFKVIETKALSELANQKQMLKDCEKKILKRVEEKMYQIQNNLANGKKNREQFEERNQQELSETIIGLQESIDEENKIRYV